MSTEDLLRHALDDLAPRVPAGDEALTGVRRAITRRRRRRAAARTAVAAILLAAVAAAGLVANAGGDEGSELDMSDPPTTTVPPATGERVQFGPVSFALPEGWEVVERGDQAAPDERLCAAPTDAQGPVFDDCAGVVLYRGALPGPEVPGEYSPGADWGWYHASDPATCPLTGDREDTVIAPEEGAAPIEERDVLVGGRTARYSRWVAICSLSEQRFEPRAWLLPEHDVLIKDVLGNSPETESILSSFEFTDE